MVAARISCSNTEVFCPLKCLCQTSEKLVVYVPGACVHPSHDPRAQLAAHALDQTFRLAPDRTSVLPITVVLPGSCGLCAGPSHCPQPGPAPSLGAVAWGWRASSCQPHGHPWLPSVGQPALTDPRWSGPVCL